jgi:hypothetical protein
MKKFNGVKVRADRNEPKVKFDKCEYVIHPTKDGKTIVKCKLTSHVETPDADVLVDLSSRTALAQDGHWNTQEENVGFPYPCTRIVTKGVAVCDPRDQFDEVLGKRVARFRAEKKAFKIHKKAMNTAVEKYISYLRKSTKLFTVKAEKVEADEVQWDK